MKLTYKLLRARAWRAGRSRCLKYAALCLALCVCMGVQAANAAEAGPAANAHATTPGTSQRMFIWIFLARSRG